MPRMNVEHRWHVITRTADVIPRDGLRHTVISAYVAKHGSLAAAATEFGCREGIIRTHYFARMGPKSAEAFHRISPTRFLAGR